MSPAIPVILLSLVSGTVGASRDQNEAATPSTITAVPLPGGVEGIRRALGDRVPMERALVGVEIARRFYSGAGWARVRDVQFARLSAWLQTCAQPAPACTEQSLPPDLVPLPGTTDFWKDAVRGGRADPNSLLLSIFGQRRTSLLYTALLSLDEDTRSWMLRQPAMIRRLSEGQIGTLVVAAPYLRVVNGHAMLPGGDAARAMWTGLAGVQTGEASSFVPAFLSAEHGHLAYLAEIAATLTPGQLAWVFGFQRPAAADRVASARRLLGALGTVLSTWRPGERPFWRPAVDPAFLLSQLSVDGANRVNLPAGQRFWEAAMSGALRDPADARARDLWRDPEPLDPAWLVSRVFAGAPAQQAARYEQVLFAARWLAGRDETAARDALLVLQEHDRFPELLRTLDRMSVSDPRRLAAMVRRAKALNDAGTGWRARARVVQWQAALLLLVRASARGTIAKDELDEALDRLAGGGQITGRRGEVLRWVATWLDRTPADADPHNDSVARALIDRLATFDASLKRRVRWEDADYEVDFTTAERARLARVRSRRAGSWLDAAISSLELGDGLEGTSVSGRTTAPPRDRLQKIVEAVRLDAPRRADDFCALARGAAASALRLLGDLREGRRSDAREAIYDFADALGAAALLETAYAVSMGWAENLPLSAEAAAGRHRFAVQSGPDQRDLSWSAPQITSDTGVPWHVRGGVLGLDVALSPVTLRRLTLKMPAAAPTLSEGSRELLVGTAVLLDRRAFSDAAQQQIVEWLSHGRARVEQLRDPRAAAAIALDAGASPLRVGLARWLAENDPPALRDFFSTTELVRIGLEGSPVPEPVSHWGNSATVLTGRQICGPLPNLFWERYAGRWKNGLLAYAVPDLQLALAAALDALKLPAVLVPDLMAAATLDFVSSVRARHPDDWRAMVEWVSGLNVDTIERYLSLLTTDGPLRPVDRSVVSER